MTQTVRLLVRAIGVPLDTCWLRLSLRPREISSIGWVARRHLLLRLGLLLLRGSLPLGHEVVSFEQPHRIGLLLLRTLDAQLNRFGGMLNKTPSQRREDSLTSGIRGNLTSLIPFVEPFGILSNKRVGGRLLLKLAEVLIDQLLGFLLDQLLQARLDGGNGVLSELRLELLGVLMEGKILLDHIMRRAWDRA